MSQGTLYLNPARQQFYLVPPGEVLDDGVFFVFVVPSAENRWPANREVSRAAIEPFAIPQEEARALIGERLGGVYGGARSAFQKVMADASEVAADREVPGGQAVRALAGRLGGLLTGPQVEKGLHLLGNTLLDMADTVRRRRDHPEPEAANTAVTPESELVLCPFCLSEVDQEDDECETCASDLADADPFVMSASEYANEPWKTCPACSEDVLRLASVCASCGESV